MIRLHAIVEGQTEEAFFNTVLAPHLAHHGVVADVQLINPKTGSTARGTKGGWNSYTVMQRHLERWMKEDSGPEVRFTSMVDLYRIPKDFPGYATFTTQADPVARVQELEKEWLREHAYPDNQRFLPYIQLHEFEALLLADPTKFDWEFVDDRHDAAIRRLVSLANSFDTPEAINHGAETAPSKRIIKEIPEYGARKVSAGPLIASKIGLETLRAKCPHFNQWVQRLETLPSHSLDSPQTLTSRTS